MNTIENKYENEGAIEWSWRGWARREIDRTYDVLDHGYLRVIETWGSDEGIVETARMSTNKGFLGWDAGPCPSCLGTSGLNMSQGAATDCATCGGKGTIPGDAKLLRFLYEHKHSTPFEFAGLTVEIQAPIMAFREWHRHRTQAYSEMSARYVQMPDLHYVPSVGRIIASAKKSGNRQASGGGELFVPGLLHEQKIPSPEYVAAHLRERIRYQQAMIYSTYEDLISFGVAKEVARLNTPVSRYSRMRATGNLRNWLAFLTLRMDGAAQFEIRQFAFALAHAIERAFPRTWELALEGMAPKKTFTPEMIAKIQKVRDLLAAAAGQEGNMVIVGDQFVKPLADIDAILEAVR